MYAEKSCADILFVTDNFLPHAGGARVYYFNLYRHMAQNLGDSVTVLTRKVPGWREFDELHADERLRIVRRGHPLTTWKYHELPKMLLPAVETSYRIARYKPQMVHFGDLFPPGLISWGLKRLAGVPYVAYCHGEEITQTDLYRYQPTVRNAIYREAAAVVAASEFARTNLERIGVPTERIHKITPGVDSVRFRPMPPNPDLMQKLELGGKLVLLTVGRLYSRKNHQAVIRAVAKLAAEIPDICYVIVGTGVEEANLRALASELQIADKVRFAGHVSDEELPQFYSVADLFVMPNRAESNGDIEGFGMVFLEANAAGKAVIGGRSGGTAESVLHGSTGLLVDYDDVAGLAESIRLLLLNPELRARMAQTGMNRACNEFSWAKRAESLHNLTIELIQSGRKKGKPVGAKEHVNA